MKKFLSLGLIAIVFVAFTFVSCDKEEDNNTETPKTEESEDNKSNEASENKEPDQKTKKKLLLTLSCEYTIDGEKYSMVTKYKYNENGDVIDEETRSNGDLLQKSTDYIYNGNIVSYTIFSYVKGVKANTSSIKTESKYDDNGRIIMQETYFDGKLSSKVTDYKYNNNVVSYTQFGYVNGEKVSTTSVKIESKYNSNGDIILEETYIDGKLSAKRTDFKYNGNVVTYTIYYYSGGNASSISYYKEEYNN